MMGAFEIKELTRKAISRATNPIFAKLDRRFENSDFYRWHFGRWRERGWRINALTDVYPDHDSAQEYREAVVCIFERKGCYGGLADRLKGIVAAFAMAKEKGIDFGLFFSYPFPMEDFLVPNTYDWCIKKEDICRNLSAVDIIFLYDFGANHPQYEAKQQEKYLRHAIQANGRQKHVYSNASFYLENKNFGNLFCELFKPSERLQSSIDCNLSAIGGEYISISCRFLDLLGDFNETSGRGVRLSEEERIQLFGKIKAAIDDLHGENPRCRVLVNSDSETFLNQYRGMDWVYIIPGNITHVDAEEDAYSYEKYEKTFLDFFLIAHAKKIYLIKSKEMYYSKYPVVASKLYQAPFKMVEV